MKVLNVALNGMGVVFSVLTMVFNPVLGVILLIMNGGLLINNATQLQKQLGKK